MTLTTRTRGYVQRNPIKSVVLGVAGLAAVTYGALAVSLTKSGERVYDGSINQQKVSYHEDATKLNVRAFSRDHENRMELRRGDTTFVFVDSDCQNNIDFQAQRRPVGYENDKLEGIIVRNPRIGVREFDSRDISQETLYGLHVGKVFTRGNQIYRALRSIIREQLREEALAGYAAIESEFGQIDISNPRAKKPSQTQSDQPAQPVVKLRQNIERQIDQFEVEIQEIETIPTPEGVKN